ncbi:cellulase family glycosylhydrolase [Joostella atrarenae]|uniref:Cellulase family glycosylhydrolase n=1 Tax=Joostella atrarenae TaxID=679257 RepID=A0ABS9J2Q0_9FLAO|nr:cellulase family glycosylhydrolase [Joostella atrarenae]MCF8714713.1 cellulase family glycosylhydrolase [Joostella atrarenae]
MVFLKNDKLIFVFSIAILITNCSSDKINVEVSEEVVEVNSPKEEDPAELVEPKNKNGTLLDRNGVPLRGVPMIITQIHQDKGVPFAKDVDNWIKLRDTYKINTVRLYWSDLWKSIRGAKENEYWNVDEALPHIEACVQNAIAVGMNIIINYHVTGENESFKDYNDITQPIDYNRNHAERLDFWTKISKKYKNNNLVFFELSNEPVFNTTGYLNADFKKNLIQIYNVVRKEAPNRQILLFSFNGTHYNLKSVVEDYSPDIDWSRTSIAFHAYHDTTSTKIEELMKTYRIVCTEWDYYGTYDYVKSINGDYLSVESMEKLNIGWVDWFNKESVTSFNRLENILLPDAETKGYAWWY